MLHGFIQFPFFFEQLLLFVLEKLFFFSDVFFSFLDFLLSFADFVLLFLEQLVMKLLFFLEPLFSQSYTYQWQIDQVINSGPSFLLQAEHPANNSMQLFRVPRWYPFKFTILNFQSQRHRGLRLERRVQRTKLINNASKRPNI